MIFIYSQLYKEYFVKVLSSTHSFYFKVSICIHLRNVYLKEKKKKNWRGQPGLNRWPLDLQSNALPLSYAPSDEVGRSIKTIYYSMQFFFLFIGQEPTTWPANNGLLMRNVTQLCLATNNILLSRIWNHAFLLLAISVLCENGRSIRFPKIFIKNQTRWSNDKTSVLNSIVAKHLDDEPGCTW